MAVIDNFNFSGLFVGEVVGSNTETRELSVFIPKLMPALARSTALSEQPTVKNNKIYSNINYNNTIRTTGSIVVRASDKQTKLPKEKSKVLVYFFEEDPRRGYWFPFNPNNESEIIDDEKYDNLFKLTVNDKSSLLTTQDEVKLEFENKDVFFFKASGRKIFTVKDQDNIGEKIKEIEEEIKNIKDSIPSTLILEFTVDGATVEENFIHRHGNFVNAKLVLTNITKSLSVQIPELMDPSSSYNYNLNVSAITISENSFPTRVDSFITKGSLFEISRTIESEGQTSTNIIEIPNLHNFFSANGATKLVIEGSWTI